MAVKEKLQANFEAHVPKVWKPRPELLTFQGIPAPMHGIAPRTVLGSKWWKETRAAALEATENHCQLCGVIKQAAKFHQWIEGHEVFEIDYLLGRMIYVETVAACYCCHSYIHQGRMKSLMEQGFVRQDRYAAIIQHGDRVLEENNLTRKNHCGPTADWEDWRMVLYDEEYPPKYKSFDEWQKAFGE